MGFKAYYSWRIFAKNNYVQVVGTKTHYLESKIYFAQRQNITHGGKTY
jgi:hypothetical protein